MADRSHEEESLARMVGDGEVFRFVFQSSPFAILIADDEGRYVEANPEACQLFGHPRQHLIGKRVYDFASPDDVLPTRGRWNDFRQHRTQSGEFALIRSDGSRRVLRYHAVAEFAPGLHLSFLEDVTRVRAMEQAQQEARSALELSEARFRALADGLPLVIWEGDADGSTRYFNRHWFEYTGLPRLPEGSPGLEQMVDIVHPEDWARVVPMLRDLRSRGEEVELTYRLRRHDGAYRWHLSRSTPIRDQDGKIIRRLGSATDIEDQRGALERLRAERDLRERFVAALSHDLRSPLSAMKMGAQLISRGADRPDFCQAQAARIVRNVDHADQLIQNLLDASRISAGESLPISRVPCDVSALVRDVVADQITVHGDRFVLEVPAEVNGLCDPAALRRTLENLLGNAIKYGAPHSPVRVSVGERDGQIGLAVHNRGTPIAPEEQLRIFQPYHRSQTGAGAAGWGLGLTLVRGTAEAHGGAVRVESSAEAGTTFTVTLARDW